jgi:hypothetical protein
MLFGMPASRARDSRVSKRLLNPIALRLPKLAAIFFFNCLLVHCLLVHKAQADSKLADTLYRYMLNPNGVAWSDFQLQSVLGRETSFRLAEVESLLLAPEKASGYPSRLRQRWSAQPGRLVPMDSLFACLGAWNANGANTSASAALKRFAGGLSAEEWAFLRGTVASMFVIHPDDTLLDAVTQERERLLEKQAANRAFQLAEKLPLDALAEAARRLQELQQAMADTLHAFANRKAKGAPRNSDKETAKTGGTSSLRDVLRSMTRKAGLVWREGSVGSERHQVSDGVFFDPGGDDTYVLRGHGKPGRILLIIDASGDDAYLSRDTLPTLPGFGGILSIHDVSGDDRYFDGGFGFGSGLFGVSAVFDASGDDRYEGGAATQGFGFFGVGLLHDAGGRDNYAATLFAQGAASTYGLGLLLDGDGNDSYTLLPVHVDDLRYRDHFLSMGQGFATGMMHGEAGGIGVLWDQAGHDTYVADIFAQGSGYWHALGLLLDDGGSDRYMAHQYAQGSGVHEAIGFLWDREGDDRYFSKGVSQGCGHDRGLGWLFDASGDDIYLATDMSQGGGSANGLGILYDALGDDAYQALKPDRALGHADQRRDRGSFGFFYDGGGQDLYPSPRVNGQAWQTIGQGAKGNGYGIDR